MAGHVRRISLPAAGVAAALLFAWSATPWAMQFSLDTGAIEEALAIGQSRIDADRVRFHVPYRVLVAKPPVDAVQVVTPFRRIVLAGEETARRGGRRIGQREALETLTAAAEHVDIYVDITFHPLNTFIGVPTYDVALIGPGTQGRLVPASIDRAARYGPRLEGPSLPSAPVTPTLPRGSQPLLGATVMAAFDGRRLDPMGRYEVVIAEGGKELVRVPIELSRMR